MEEHTKHTKLLLIILAVFLLGGSILGFAISRSKKSVGQGDTTTKVIVEPTLVPTRIPYPINGMMELQVQKSQGLKVQSQGKPFTVDLVATSGKSKIAGYDVVMTYDKNAFVRQSVQNNDKTFRIFTYDRADHVAISATKQLQSTQVTTFTATSILSFTFLPKKAGTFTFSLKPVGKESSKYVDDGASPTYPATKDLVLEIR